RGRRRRRSVGRAQESRGRLRRQGAHRQEALRMKSVDKLIAALKRLPGVGPKQAERLSIHLLRSPNGEVEGLIEALREAKAAIRYCARCGDFTDRELCRLCSDP